LNRGINQTIDDFVNQTRDVIYLREIDRLLIIRPNKIHHVNDSAFHILNLLYAENNTSSETEMKYKDIYSLSIEKAQRDVFLITDTLKSLLQEDYKNAQSVGIIPFDPSSITYPVLSEIALTYRCNNSCEFCYASSPYRDTPEMTTDDVKVIIEKIHNDAHVPTISFTGGEPTLRKDLPHLINHASKLGMRTNLITNGTLLTEELVENLHECGLNSAQVSLESHIGDIHNEIVGNRTAFEKTIEGIHFLKSTGIHVHTNTTINLKNRDHLIPLVDFIKYEFDFPYLSMNMIIKTGTAQENDNQNVSYSTIEDIVKPVIEHCNKKDMKFVWYSPTPYCLFNPVDYDLGSKSCACVSGLLSVNPRGDILPCSSYDKGIGSLLKKDFQKLWNSDEALYYRDRRYVPPVCTKCEYEVLCGGACPLYWEHAGSFKEIENCQNKDPFFKNMIWKIEKKIRISAKGISGRF